MNSDAFINRIKEILGDDSANLFAKKCGISEGTVRNCLKGKIPGSKILKKICEVKKVNIEWIVYGMGPKDKAQPVLALKKNPAPYAISEMAQDKVNEPFVDAVGRLKEVFDSKDEMLVSAIMANLYSFSRSVRREKENQALREKINDLEGRLAALEDKLSRGDQAGGPAADPETAIPLLNGTTGT